MSEAKNELPEESPDSNTYDLVKTRFEMRCMKVHDPFVYIRLHPQPETHGTLKPIQMKHSELLQFYIHLKFFSKDEKGKWQKCSFINAWVQDAHEREVASVVVDPQKLLEPTSKECTTYGWATLQQS